MAEARFPYVGAVKSRVFHKTSHDVLDLHVEKIAFPSRASAAAAGRRPCRICKPCCLKVGAGDCCTPPIT